MTFWIENVNQLTRDEFVGSFGCLVEHHPTCTEVVYQKRPFSSKEDLLQHFWSYLDSISSQEKETILKNYPYLGTKAEMTKFSVLEHKTAGLDKLEGAEEMEMGQLNDRYFDKFGFPCIVCVKESCKSSILVEMRQRCANSKEMEVFKGIEEVKKILRHRLDSLFEK